PRTWAAVLRPPSSPAPWPGGSSYACARCGEIAAGIALGELCPRCVQVVTRRASHAGRLVAIVTTLLVAGYVVLSLRPVAGMWQASARMAGAGAVLTWYLLTYR